MTYGTFHDIDSSALAASADVTPEQAAPAARAVAGSPAVADASELAELLAMLGLDARQAREYGRHAPSGALKIQGHKKISKSRRAKR